MTRIQAIQVFDIKYFGIGHILSFQSALWYPLIKNDFQLCERIVRLIPSFWMESDLVTAGNHAHYLLLTERKEEAIEIYRKFDGKHVSDELEWREMNLNDFKTLRDFEHYKGKIDDAIADLGWTFLV